MVEGELAYILHIILRRFGFLLSLSQEASKIEKRPIMNKTQLVEAVALESNLPKVEARKAVDALIRVIHQSLEEGERVTLSGLGSFSVQQHGERMGRNPRTGAPVPIPARKSIKFRPLIEIE